MMRPAICAFIRTLPKWDLKEINKPGAVGATISETFDLAKEDQADDLLFNDVIWKSVKGAGSRMPPPVRAAFFLPITAHP